MEGLGMIKRGFYKDKRLFITGHTGFKGSWLALWLTELGARVYGYSLSPPTDPNLFTLINLTERLGGHIISDIRDRKALEDAIHDAQPEIVFHLAAQSLVRKGYSDPVYTYETNIMGTVNLLEAIRHTDSVKACVIVTSDKCYENQEWVWPYRETDALGGIDPYSSSKACAEIITASYRKSFLSPKAAVATVRAGNVIGGGDWAQDRLIPDFIRAVIKREVINVRYPEAIRPWQHVLEPLYGYLLLAEKLYNNGSPYSGAWNFGPDATDTRPVKWILEYLKAHFKGASWYSDPSKQPEETLTLKLDSSKAHTFLGWRPLWQIEKALDETAKWYKAYLNGEDMKIETLKQIREYDAQIR